MVKIPEFLTDPQEIERKSMEIISGLVPELDRLPPLERAVVMRVVHTTGDPAAARLLRFSPGACEAGVAAIKRGAKLFTDVQMLLAGVSKRVLARFGMEPCCYISQPEVAATAAATGLTRAMLAVRRAGQELNGAVVCIGNAPTALFELLRLVQEEGVRPGLVIGTPVGFVGAAESKELLQEVMPEGPYITVTGTRGGSTIAAAILNALLYEAEKEEEAE